MVSLGETQEENPISLRHSMFSKRAMIHFKSVIEKGCVDEWLYKGSGATQIASLYLVLDNPISGPEFKELRYIVSLQGNVIIYRWLMKNHWLGGQAGNLL
jgi:hypothetical protein